MEDQINKKVPLAFFGMLIFFAGVLVGYTILSKEGTEIKSDVQESPGSSEENTIISDESAIQNPEDPTWKSSEEVRQSASRFVSEKLMSPGGDAQILGVSEENGVYKLRLSVKGNEMNSYATKDGKLFFPQGMEMEDVNDTGSTNPASSQTVVEKTPRPVVDLYVMSLCPFGNKAEDTLKPVYDLLHGKADFNFYYIVQSTGESIQSLHGQQEVDQDMREACVMEEYGKDKWFGFVSHVNKNCGSNGLCWEDAAEKNDIEIEKISDCVDSKGFSLMEDNEIMSNNAGVKGSPTMIINGYSVEKVYEYGNPESYKKAICDSFEFAPPECQKVLPGQSQQTGGSCASN